MKFNFIPLGGGQEIGANSYYIEFSNATIIIDAGSNPKRIGFESLPKFQHIKKKPDAIFISHAHFDHIGALPVYASIYSDVNIFLTQPTYEISNRMLHNTISLISRKVRRDKRYFFHNYYNHKLLDIMYDRLKFNKIKYNQSYQIPGTNVKFKFFDAGHILGSAGILLYTNSHYCFYTGDYKLSGQTLQTGAKFDIEKIDTLITETTYAQQDTKNYEEEAEKFLSFTKKILLNGGKVLLPAFAVGRTQQLIKLISDAMNKRYLPKVKVYAVGLGIPITEIYNKYLKIRLRVRSKNSINEFIKSRTPIIIIATNGMMVEHSASFELAKNFISDKKNGIIFTGFVAENTPGAKLLRIVNLKTNEFFYNIKVRTKNIKQFHLSAHSDNSELRSYIESTKPKSVILVHSEKERIKEFQEDFIKKGYNIYAPKNGELLYFDNRLKKIVSAKNKLAVITTTGISLLSNYRRVIGRKANTREEIVQFINENGKESSAEIESIFKLRLKYPEIKDGKIYLLSSDTIEGKLCARVLKQYFILEGYDAEVNIVKKLVPQANEFKNIGLVNFINVLSDIIEKHAINAIINATGGFKAEISYATLMGVLYKTNVYYLFDDFKEIIDLPRLPVNFDFKYLRDYYDMINTVLETNDFETADKMFLELPDEIKRLLFKREKLQKYYLTAPGTAFMRAYKYYIN